jgi:hypothetical protein
MRRILPLCILAAASWLDSEKEFFLGIAHGFREEDLSATCLTDEFQAKVEADVDTVANDYEVDNGAKTLLSHLSVVGEDLAQIVHDCELSAIPIAASTAIQTDGLDTIIGRAMVNGADIAKSIERFHAQVETNFYGAGEALGEAFGYLFPPQKKHMLGVPHVGMNLTHDYIGDVVYNFTTGLATGLQATNATSVCLSSIQHVKVTSNTFFTTVLNCTQLNTAACKKVETSLAALLKEYDGIISGCKFPVLMAKIENLANFDAWVDVFHNLYENGNNHVLQRTFQNLSQALEKENYFMIGYDMGVILRLTLDFTVS